MFPLYFRAIQLPPKFGRTSIRAKGTAIKSPTLQNQQTSDRWELDVPKEMHHPLQPSIFKGIIYI